MSVAKCKVCRYCIAGIDNARLRRWHHVTMYLTLCMCVCVCVIGMDVTLLTYSVLRVSTSWSWRANPCIFEWSDALSPNENGLRDLSCSRHEMKRWYDEGRDSEWENRRKLEQYIRIRKWMKTWAEDRKYVVWGRKGEWRGEWKRVRAVCYT